MSTELVERFVRGVRIHLSGGTSCMALPGYHDDWNAPRDLSTWYNQHLGGLSGLSEAEQDSCRSALVDILHRRDARALQLFEVTRQLLLPEECLDIFLSQEARDHTEDLWGLANAVHWGVASGVLAWSESWRPMVLDGARRQRVWLYLEAFRHDRDWFVEHIALLFGQDAGLAGRRMVHMCIGATPEDVQALLAVVQAAAARLGGDVLQAILAVGHPKPVA